MALTDWLCECRDSLRDDALVGLSLGHYTGSEPGLRKIMIRRVIIRGSPMLGFTYRYQTRDVVKNADIETGIDLVLQFLSSDFQTATLTTTSQAITFERHRNGRETLRRIAQVHAPVPTAHDKIKPRLLATAGKPYLHDLGITTADGTVLKSATDKYRQINRYVELLAPMISDDMRSFVDMGCGKGYLTFALYDYLTTVRHLQADVTGVERRHDLVAAGNRMAAASGFERLRFAEGCIEAFEATGIDALIALHACDTATDDAIAKGIAAGARLIVVAPCCHKQIRGEIESHHPGRNSDLIIRHGILMERQAELVTDAMRALIMELHGYRTRVFEFIAGTHTPKNLMIAGNKDPRFTPDPALIHRTLEQAKAQYGITRHYLETALEQWHRSHPHQSAEVEISASSPSPPGFPSRP